jgi:hypothetical protein
VRSAGAAEQQRERALVAVIFGERGASSGATKSR